MRLNKILFAVSALLVLSFLLARIPSTLAETKMVTPAGPGQIIPKIPQTPNDPVLENGGVYPMWGPVCQRYTYHTTYRDKEGRPPEYVRMYFNGDWLDVQKEDPAAADYKKGVRYIYQFVPTKIGPNFFFFEASNGVGKTREGIIDSPGNGPVLFESDFLHNTIAVVDRTGKKILNYSTGKEWVGGVALSDDGRYLAAQTSFRVLLFDLTKPTEPVWVYGSGVEGASFMLGGDVKGGVAISGDGEVIFASLGSQALLFNKSANKPVWQYEAGNAYNVAISHDGQYVAAGTAGSESDVKTNLLILWNAKSSQPLWQYHASGNFHDVALSADGSWVVGSTGCPDRRAYFFSRDSNQPKVKTEMLTYDSPVQRTRITSDGNFAAFTTDGGPDSVMVALLRNDSTEPLWKFTSPDPRAARAMGMTPDGQFILAANTQGDVYLLGKESSVPVSEWHLNTTLGGADISDDGAVLAVGGTDNKVHLLNPQTREDISVGFEEFVEEVDVSANGQAIAVGTGGSPYFFEDVISPNMGKVYSCDKIIEPPPLSEAMKYRSGEVVGGGVKQKVTQKIIGWWEKIVNFFKRLLGIKVKAPETETAPASGSQGNEGPSESGDEFFDKEKGEGVCGNSLCEPNKGESKESCPRDCSAQE